MVLTNDQPSSVCVNTSEITKFMGQTWAQLGPVGSRWAPCLPYEPCYQGWNLARDKQLTVSFIETVTNDGTTIVTRILGNKARLESLNSLK